MRFATTKKVFPATTAWGQAQHQAARETWRATIKRVFIRLKTSPVPTDDVLPAAMELHPEAGKHAAVMDRYPSTPGEAMLEVEALMIWVLEVLNIPVPLCRVCWRLHPEGER